MINSTRIDGAMFLLLSCLYGYFATEIPLDYFSRQETFTARTLPYTIAVAGIIISTLLIVSPSAPTDWSFLPRLHWKPVAALLVLMSVYGWMLEDVGFPPATIAFLVIAWFVMGERRPGWLFGLSIPLVLGFWLLMHQLGIYLYPGDWIAPWLDR